jgi:OOP family OmpA-OmpF porin
MYRMSLLAGTLLLPVIAAAQQPVVGPYIGGEAGANFAGPTGETTNAGPIMLSSAPIGAVALVASGLTRVATNVDTNPGPLGVVDLGWGFGNGLRAEMEGSYRSNGVSNIRSYGISSFLPSGPVIGNLLPLANVGGSLATYAVTANLKYDIPISGLGLPLQPYIGAGLGYAWLHFNNAGGNGSGALPFGNNNFLIGPDVVSLGTAGAFAYQAIVGMSLPLQVLPGLDATLEYRFFGTARADVPVTRSTPTNFLNGVPLSSVTRNGFEAHDNAVLIGVRYAFGAP